MKLRFIPPLLIVAAIIVFAQSYARPKERKNNMTEETGFALLKVGQIAVRVKDLDRATAFYRDKLGLKHLHQAPSLSVLDCGGITLLLTRPENSAEDHPSSVIYFDVEDIQRAFKSLSDRSVVFVERPNKVGSLGDVEVWIAVFLDSEDNMMGLRSMTPKK
ncbi:MAG: VOC family protein [Chloracidobacterium sp.]|nr:VOC family protein [Chloracidobacterium sp.]